MAYWGIDLGGTKIEAVVLDQIEHAHPLCRVRIDTEQEHGYKHILERIAHLVKKVANECGEKPLEIGIGHPGVIDPKSQLIKNSNTVCLNGMPLKADLEEALGVRLVMANDANCFALAENRFGAAQGASSVFGVIMGTGVGGGIVLNGNVLVGAQGIAGEWGHNILIDDGPECYCGKQGCVEAVISGPALEAYYTKRSGKELPLSKIASLADSSADLHAQATLQYLLANFGKALTVVINILDPECIVLGGGLSNIEALYSEGVEEIKKYVFNTRLETKVVKATLGDSAGVFGAALLTTNA